MIAAIATWLVGRGLVKAGPGAKTAAKVLVLVGLAIALVAALVIGMKIHDRNVIDRHEKEERAAAARAALEGERRANAATDAADREFEEQQEALREGSDHEIERDPEGARRPVGPGQRGYFDGLPGQGDR
jgi:uncharacterized protein HemX